MRDRGPERTGPEGDALVALNLKARPCDRRAGVTSAVAAAGEKRVDRRVKHALGAGQPGLVCDDVLVEAQLPAGAQHAMDLAQRNVLVVHRAEHKRCDGGVELATHGGQCLGAPCDDADAQRHVLGGLLCELAQVRLGLDGDHLGHRWRVVGEIQAVTGADLDDPSLEARQQRATVLGAAAPVGRASDVRIETGEALDD